MLYSRLGLLLCFLIVYCESAPDIDWDDIGTKLRNFRDKALPVAQGACGVLNAIQPPNQPYQPSYPIGSSYDPQPSSRRFFPQQQFPSSFYPTFPNNNPQAGWGRFPQAPPFPQAPAFPRAPAFPPSPWVPQGPRFPQAPRFPEAPRVPQAPRFPQAPTFPQSPGFPRFPQFPMNRPSVPQVPKFDSPNPNGNNNGTDDTEQADLNRSNRPSPPQVPPFIPPTDQNLGGAPIAPIAPSDTDMELSFDGESNDVDGGINDIDSGTNDIDGGTNDIDGGTNDIDGGTNDIDGGTNDIGEESEQDDLNRDAEEVETNSIGGETPKDLGIADRMDNTDEDTDDDGATFQKYRYTF